MSILICPVCKNALMAETTHYRCAQNHLFDKSRHGYVNLLLTTMRHSKTPGDNKEMIKSRADFLKQNYYAPIANLLNTHIQDHLVLSPSAKTQLVEVGCGNGYYLQQTKNYLAKNFSAAMEYWGVDISKEAIQFAAKDAKDIHWIVSNMAELPFANQSVQTIISVFSPYHVNEFQRILAKNGHLFMIYPGKNHLIELRNILFSQVKEIDPERMLKESDAYFSSLKKIPLTYSIQLLANQDIANLFGMTPYYWRCTPEKRSQILKLENLTLTIDVVLQIFQCADI